MVVSSCFYPQLVQLVHLLWIPSSAGWVTDAILSEPWKDWISGEICRGNTDFLFASSKPLGETQKQLKFPSSPDPCPTRLGSCQTQKRLWPISRPHTSGRGGRQSTRSIFGLQKVSFKIPQIGCDQEIQLEIAWNGWFCSPKMARKGKVTTEYDRWFCREMESSPSWT